ncbi:unnamed protein product [Urochloa humidicola]
MIDVRNPNRIPLSHRKQKFHLHLSSTVWRAQVKIIDKEKDIGSGDELRFPEAIGSSFPYLDVHHIMVQQGKTTTWVSTPLVSKCSPKPRTIRQLALFVLAVLLFSVCLNVYVWSLREDYLPYVHAQCMMLRLFQGTSGAATS